MHEEAEPWHPIRRLPQSPHACTASVLSRITSYHHIYSKGGGCETEERGGGGQNDQTHKTRFENQRKQTPDAAEPRCHKKPPKKKKKKTQQKPQARPKENQPGGKYGELKRSEKKRDGRREGRTEEESNKGCQTTPGHGCPFFQSSSSGRSGCLGRSGVEADCRRNRSSSYHDRCDQSGSARRPWTWWSCSAA